MKRINTQKLVDAFEADKELLDKRIDCAEDEIIEKLAPYFQSGVFTEDDILPLTDKLVAAEKADFDKNWATVLQFVEDDGISIEDVEVPAPAVDGVSPDAGAIDCVARMGDSEIKI